jgi:CBS domain-containing protein
MAMPQTVQEVMTPQPVTLRDDATLKEAAETMRDCEIGDVIVLKANEPCGIITDRDLVVRGIAEGKDPAKTRLKALCSHELMTVSPQDPIDKAIDLMRQNAIRRLPVCDEAGKVVGVVSLGDLAIDRDPDSLLAEISVAPSSD